ncbi:MAG: hypothetical protein KTR25_16455 [Myxococcales bacterium]|nr:hypothetical protein [Myxococcales bacterium]
MSKVETISPETTVLNLLAGRWVSQAISAAAVLGISDVLTENSTMSLPELAEATDCDSNMLKRLMAILVGEGIYFYEPSTERYANTNLGRTLATEGNLRHLAEFLGSPNQVSPWAALAQCIRSGESAFKVQHGQDLYPWLDNQPQDASLYDQAIDQFTLRIAQALSMAYDFGSAQKVMDVGGGLGTTLAILLAKWPHLQGTLIDREQVIRRAIPKFRDSQLADRCCFEATDFFENLPQNGDIYILKHILHNWNKQDAVSILKHCRKVVATDGRLLVIEGILPPGTDRNFARLMDLQMMMLFGKGGARTKQEFKSLFSLAGWKLLHTTYPLDEFSRLLIGKPV